MAEFTAIAKPTAVTRVTDDVASAHTIYNKTGGTFYAGIIININRGNAVLEHLDADTMVEVKPGDSVVIDPTAYSGTPVGVGVSFRSAAVDATPTDEIIRAGVITQATAKKPKAKK